MNDLRFKGPPPGREAIEAAIQTLIDLLDAMTPDSDFEFADDSWEGDDREDMEPDDHYGGDVCDEPHDQDSESDLKLSRVISCSCDTACEELD